MAFFSESELSLETWNHSSRACCIEWAKFY
ncbi:hypothetical protein F383_28190 [Gossypium arboreum]|uniref:Uncharacterized protein n=1 Tax=Gossypium arboreum TaxID=29729 RepID=A0A0B0P7I0_GOSAR|nr:hypothetical protein F383_28190 [Gossypium arboreum]